MKNSIKLSGLLLLGSLIAFGSCTKKDDQYAWIKNAIETTNFQLKKQLADADNVKGDTVAFPRTIVDGKVQYVNPLDWTSGFFPGSLWFGYSLTSDDALKSAARRYTDSLASIQFFKGTHDLGFMLYCAYGNALQISPQADDATVLVNGSKSLATRFDPKVGLIRSWDFGPWSYPVIIDNMMNLDMLFWATKQTGDSLYYNVAVAHADNTMKNHFRDDMSTYHVVSYDPKSGDVESKGTFQGYSDSSSWARGQAWGLYGYTLCYRETGDKKYLDHAQKIAEYIMKLPSMPSDKVPYWDYCAPNKPNAPRDASAAAITASALLELSTMVADGNAYFDYAQSALKSLSSEAYLAKKGENEGFILLHSTGYLPGDTEIDVPINYADYYYLEALSRYMKIKGIDPKTL